MAVIMCVCTVVYLKHISTGLYEYELTCTCPPHKVCLAIFVSQVVTSKQPKFGLTQELIFSRISEFPTG